MRRIILVGAASALTSVAWGQQMSADSTATKMQQTQNIDEVVVQVRKPGVRRMGLMNGLDLSRGELFKAACCNLGESFVNNPSVDVNYSDAATGAKQIKLLGLSGAYVQMLTENIPNFRGAAMPYSLGYVPGSWLKSIQVSKGNSSVKNGYEAMTGQINVEYVKPEDPEGAAVNVYGNTMSRLEANVDANMHLKKDKSLATELLAHFENEWSHHDQNHDGFQDNPLVRQYNLQNRWYWKQGNYLFHGGLSLLNESRRSGQTEHDGMVMADGQPMYKIGIDTKRYEAYMKHALILNAESGANIALMGSTTMHEQDAQYGFKTYGVNEKNVYGSLIYETNMGEYHNLSAGLSINYDYLGQNYRLTRPEEGVSVSAPERETTPGAYAQYTLNLHNRFTLMAGARVDHSSLYGTFFTPRFHLKWMMNDYVTLRASAGKGYRSPHVLAENNFLMASGRQLVIDEPQQEAAWNYGASLAFLIPVGGKTLKLNADYYYTDFLRQTIIDYDTNPGVLHLTNLDGKSYSHTFQVDATINPYKGLELSAAYRYNLVKANYGGKMLWKPLQSRYKALFSASYKSPLSIWQFDATLALNGGGRLPAPYTMADGTQSWANNFKAYPLLNLQVTRSFRHFQLYVGGENLTNYKQKSPIIAASEPWSSSFEPTLVYGPVTGAMGYVGIRLYLGKHMEQ